MPFNGRRRRHAFTLASIRQNAPALSGIYALSNGDGWVYAGQATDVQAALWKHLRDPQPRLREARPTGFAFELCEIATRNGRLERLIRLLAPSCNRATMAKP